MTPDKESSEGQNKSSVTSENGDTTKNEDTKYANQKTKKDTRGRGQEEVTFVRVKLPHRNKGEIFAIAEQLMGASRLKIICEDGKSRMARIPGKMKKRRWIRTGDLLVVKPWEFQDEKADVIRRYKRTESNNLSKRGLIPDSINVF